MGLQIPRRVLLLGDRSRNLKYVNRWAIWSTSLIMLAIQSLCSAQARVPETVIGTIMSSLDAS